MSDYFSHYLLSYFDLERLANIPQILHVFHGKRTPSMFYRIEKNKWHSGFNLSSRIQIEQLEVIVNKHLSEGSLTIEEKGYKLTNFGLEKCQKYFNKHYYPNKIRTFTNVTIRASFWERLQLFSQVFSELSYHNNSYVPIIKHPQHQESVRNLFQESSQSSHERNALLHQWIKEQSNIFKQMDNKMVDVLVNQLTGHKNVGQTKNQIRMLMDMEPLEFRFYMNDVLEVLTQIIKNHRKNVPIHSAILDSILIEHQYGLSISTKESYELLKKGHTINEIASIRNIKANTVKEHILEMAFVFEKFPYTNFIPKTIYEQLKIKFENQKKYTFKEALNDFEQLEFIHFRLTELERMRRNEESNRTGIK